MTLTTLLQTLENDQMTQGKHVVDLPEHATLEREVAQDAAYIAINKQLRVGTQTLPNSDLSRDVNVVKHLPAIELVDSKPDMKQVAKEVGAGVNDELQHHLGRVALNAAEGVLVGAAFSAAATILLPETMVVIGGAAAGLAIVEVAKNVAGRVHDADVVSRQEKFSPAEVEKAKTNLREFGAGATDTAAQLAGGAVANSLIGAFGREVATKIANPFKIANHSVVAADYGPAPALTTTGAWLAYSDTNATKPATKKQ